jgi:hypothetical protein
MARPSFSSVTTEAIALTILTSMVILMLSSCSQDQGPKDAVALYDDCYFEKGPSFSEFNTGNYTGEEIARVYIELPDKQRFMLSELPEDVAAVIFENTPRLPGTETRYSDLYSSFTFRNGKLVAAKLDSGSELFRISAHEEGPYLSFPIDKDALVREFGEPVEWRKPFKRPSGP